MKGKKGKSEGSAGQAGIRVLTVALFIILLAFFIVLNAIGVVDERRQLAALGSLTGSFGILPGGLSPMKGKGEDIMPPQAPMVSRKMHAGEVDEVELSRASRVFMRSVPEGEVVSIRDQVLFDKGSHKIKPASYAFLRRVCSVINEGDYPVEIAGHTDSRPPAEKAVRSNWELSSLRALEVFKFFVVIGKVLPSRLTAYGCGEYKPVASNETRQTRQLNRRVDIMLHAKLGEKLNKIYQKSQSKSVVFKRFVFRIFD